MKQYQDALRHVLRHGEKHEDRTGVETTSAFGYQLALDLRETGFPMVTIRKLPFRWIATELLWMLKGSTDERELSSQGVNTWAAWATAEACAKFGREPGDLGPTYGHLLRKFGSPYVPLVEHRLRLKRLQESGKVRSSVGAMMAGYDQLLDLCRRMDTEPNSRRLILSQWDPLTVNTVTVPPCHPLLQVKLHGNDGISLRIDQRSADAAVGLAWDIAHFGLLLCLLAWCTSRQPRHLVFHIGDLHIYNNHHELVKTLLDREPRQSPQLEITKDMFHAQPASPGADTFINLLQFMPEHVKLINYNPWPAIRAEVAV